MPRREAQRNGEAASILPAPRLDVSKSEIAIAGESRPIRSKTLAVLQHLIASKGQTVSNANLRDALWTATHGAEGGPKQCIRELRKILDDDARRPRFIETIGRTGYRLIGHIDVIAQSAGDSRDAPLCVGRGEELDSLSRQLSAALGGQRMISLVSGAAGDGKTTLVAAFMAAQSNVPALWSALGFCTPYEDAREPYAPLIDILSMLLAGSLSTLVADLIRTVAPAWIPQFPTIFRRQEVEQAQARLLGSSSDRMRRELTELFERLSTFGAGLIALEDIHWADPSTLAWLDHWARKREPARIMIVATARSGELVRPEHPAVPFLGALNGNSQFNRLTLRGLSSLAVREYVSHHCGNERVVGPLATAISKHTNGHPIFVSALMQHWQDSRRRSTAPESTAPEYIFSDVPSNVQAFIDGQVAALSHRDRSILQLASVAGMEFAAAGLAECPDDIVVKEEACESLARRQLFLRRSGSEEWPDGTVSARYAFHHLLYQQAFYSDVPPARRTALHRRIATQLENAFGEMTGDIAHQLAHHFELGRALLPAARYRRLLGERALSRRVMDTACEQLEHASRLLKLTPPTAERTAEELTVELSTGLAAMVQLGVGSKPAGRAYSRAFDLATELQNRRAQARSLRGLWEFHFSLGNTAVMSEIANQLVSVMPSEDEEAFMWTHNVVGQTRWVVGAPEKAEQHINAVLSAYNASRHGDFVARTGSDPGVQCYAYATVTRQLLGSIDDSERHFTNGMALAEQLQRPFAKAQMLWGGVLAARERRSIRTVRERALALLEICDTHQVNFWRRALLTLLGWAEALDGDAGGLNRINRSLRSNKALRHLGFRAYRLMLLAHALEHHGHLKEALMAADDALAIASRTGERWYLPELLLLHKRVSR